ncbi:MAG: hypothetical protein ILA19_02980 [Bacilli bacterium]|nr:hypothetical protein [Bacilli bacterium]
MQKHGIVQKFTAFLLAVTLSLIMIPSQIVYADYNGGGTGGSGVNNGYIDGASASKSFLRCYVIEPEHGIPYTQAVDVFYGSVPSGYVNGQEFNGYQITRITSIQDRKSAPDGLPKPYLYNGGSFIGNGAAIKSWMMDDNSHGEKNIDVFIQSCFGSDVLDLFKDTTTEKFLVIEPGWWHGVYQGKNYTGAGFIGTSKDWLLLYHDLELPNGGVMKDLDNTVGQTCMMLERPILGINCEYPVYSNINATILADHGYGVHTFSNLLSGQTTCDEPSQPSPHDPPDESNGKVTIVKSYRVKDSNGNMEHVATTSRSNLDGNIQIENEQGWNVVGWRASATTNTGVVGAPTWNAPSDQGEGNKAQKVNIKPNNCLYVLLEKVEEEEEELGDYDYIISQSRITKKISMSAPVSSNGTLQGIVDKEFKWSIAAHPECQGHSCHGCSCAGHYETCDACGGSGGTDEAPCGSCGGSGEVEVENTERCYFFA